MMKLVSFYAALFMLTTSYDPLKASSQSVEDSNAEPPSLRERRHLAPLPLLDVSVATKKGKSIPQLSKIESLHIIINEAIKEGISPHEQLLILNPFGTLIDETKTPFFRKMRLVREIIAVKKIMDLGVHVILSCPHEDQEEVSRTLFFVDLDDVFQLNIEGERGACEISEDYLFGKARQCEYYRNGHQVAVKEVLTEEQKNILPERYDLGYLTPLVSNLISQSELNNIKKIYFLDPNVEYVRTFPLLMYAARQHYPSLIDAQAFRAI